MYLTSHYVSHCFLEDESKSAPDLEQEEEEDEGEGNVDDKEEVINMYSFMNKDNDNDHYCDVTQHS